MKTLFYKFSVGLSRILGAWVFVLISGAIATGFFLFNRDPRRISRGFYQVLFPDKNRLVHLWYVWKQYQRFTNLFRDRFMLLDFDRIDYQSRGWDTLQEASETKQGGIILMSHMGNWEIAAHLMMRKNDNLQLLLFLGTKQKEQLEKLQKESLGLSGIKTIAVDQNTGSPFHLIEANQVLKEGGFVSMTGDMLWHESQRSIPVRFLDHQVHLPESPYLLAMLSERPLFVLFSFRTGKNQYTIQINKPIYVKADSRKDRQEAVRRAAQEYADLLEQAVRQYPFEWFHFDSFLGKELE